jgi:hypothetical protein
MRIPKPTYGSVTATLALFVALAGTSYAAITVTGSNIKNGSLTGADLKNQSVKSSDIDNGSLTGSDFRNGSLTSSDVGDGSLLASDFKTGELPAGPAGPAGLPGPGGLGDVIVRRNDVTVSNQDEVESEASCANGETAVGGGARHSGTVGDQIAVVYGGPLAANGSELQDGEKAGRWVAGFNSNVTAPRTVTTFVLCTKP